MAHGPILAAKCDFYDDPNDLYDLDDRYCGTAGSGNTSGGSQPDGSQGGTGPTDVGHGEDGRKKRRRRRKKGKKKQH